MNLVATDARQYRRSLASDVRLGSEAEVSAGPAPRPFFLRKRTSGSRTGQSRHSSFGLAKPDLPRAISGRYVDLSQSGSPAARKDDSSQKGHFSGAVQCAVYLLPYPLLPCSQQWKQPQLSLRTIRGACKEKIGLSGICHFASYAQCLATASGTFSYCGINPHVAFAPQLRGYWRGAYEPNERWAARRIR